LGWDAEKISNAGIWLPPSDFDETGLFYGRHTQDATVEGGGYDPRNGAYISFVYDDARGGPYHRFTVRENGTRGGVPSHDSDTSGDDDSEIDGRPSAPPLDDSETEDYIDDINNNKAYKRYETEEEEEQEEDGEVIEKRKKHASKTLRKIIIRKLKNGKAAQHASWISNELALLQEYIGVITMAIVNHNSTHKDLCKFCVGCNSTPAKR
jgi:hypothetical protein